ncbi:methionyl-tRNA formyltransferase [Hoyosella sp. G463]|uniref:Methionyl-tRNA formyltransferase n=1 Tax=Lolliginicoccus lacisalsi TaxID=2742202 RepID=A0A927JBA6_9ACTN|nr:methionyl-tRNA formyltransferase [Lolliginicoccus lacisalsi]MBD8505272.1 methionyl-tRNA formyltransferase [Lolliginicoccus lacisalsi]
MRLVFAGTPEPAVPALRRLIDSPRHEVAAVVTRPDAAAGRGRRARRSPVGQLADEHGIPVLAPRRPSDPEFLEQLSEIGPDCCPVVAYGALLTREVIAIPRLGWINLHFSLLPAWRGAAPVQAAIAAGDDMTGATTFRIDEGLDTGDVLGTMTERIRPTDTSGVLLERLAEAGAVLLEHTMDGLEDSTLTAIPQSTDGVSHAPKVTVEAARARWDQPGHIVERHIRAMTPAPGAWTMVGDLRVKITSAGVDEATRLAPGEIQATKSTVRVGTATGALQLDTVQPQGKKAMRAADWARGARLAEGATAQ